MANCNAISNLVKPFASVNIYRRNDLIFNINFVQSQCIYICVLLHYQKLEGHFFTPDLYRFYVTGHQRLNFMVPKANNSLTIKMFLMSMSDVIYIIPKASLQEYCVKMSKFKQDPSVLTTMRQAWRLFYKTKTELSSKAPHPHSPTWSKPNYLLSGNRTVGKFVLMRFLWYRTERVPSCRWWTPTESCRLSPGRDVANEINGNRQHHVRLEIKQIDCSASPSGAARGLAHRYKLQARMPETEAQSKAQSHLGGCDALFNCHVNEVAFPLTTVKAFDNFRTV